MTKPFFSRDALRKTIHFEYIEGGVGAVPSPHTTGWRQLPFAVCAQICEGTIRLLLPDGVRHELGDGAAFILPSGLANCVEQVSRKPLVSRFAHFTATVYDTIDMMTLSRPPLLIEQPAADRLGILCQKLAAPEPGQPTLELAFRQQSLGFSLAAEILALSSRNDDTSQLMLTADRLAPALRHLHDNLSDKIRLDDLAAMADLSQSRFCSVFKQTLGVAPIEYVSQLRLKQATSLLLGTDFSISRIAEKVGYRDPFTFSRAFKRTYGMSPQHYRLQVRAGLWITG